MKRRILSLVLCAALLLSLCLFMGAGVVGDAAADMAETAGTVEDTQSSPAVGPILPLVVTRPQTSPYRAARAPSLADTGETQDDGLKLTKTVTPKADGGYTVHLEAYTTGTVTTSTTTKPCDIVLVLDQSGSMADNFNGNTANKETDTRQYAMKQAVNTFIDNVAKKAKGEGVEHRIAIVKFAGKSTNTVGDDTYKEDGNRYNYSQVVKELTAVNDASGANATTLKTAVNQLQAKGGTQTQNGLNHAQRLLSSVDSARDSSKVVIVFTDGMPGDYGFDESVATSAIASAKLMKDAGVTVYTVGIFTGANVDQLYGNTGFSKNSNGSVGSYWANWGTSDGTDVPAGNRFLNYVSSNFKNASAIGLKAYSDWKLYYGWEVTQNFTRDKTGYYMTASNSTALNNIFTSISQTIGSANIDLGSETVIKDIVTPYFTVPQNAGAIRLSTAAYNGREFGAPVAADPSVTAAIDPATRAVNVTGFDFNQNYVSTNAKADGTFGKKLIIEFDVSVEAGFLGGNQVPTNDGQSGIYAKGIMIKAFDVPTQDVEVKSITPTADDKTIYLGDSANLQELVHQNATFDGTNNAFVNVTYTVKDENGGTVGTCTVPAGSSSGIWEWSDAASGGTVAPEQTTTYTVTCTVSPTQSGTYESVESVSKDAAFTITVNTCSLTISKAVTGDGANPNQTFVFDVKDSAGKVVTTIVLKAGGEKTITGLAVGTYTVTEDTNWSWSYSIVGDNNKTATLSGTMPSAEVAVTNHYNSHNWLTSIADVINTWISGSAAQKN